jgi:tRNA threonylcarbamoyl adenosine modification protein (Sua5/YciO/YrdC/YwlC family)
MKTLTPGPYTFLLKATSDVPRRLMNQKKKTIGVRVPNNPIAHALLAELGEPIMSSTLIPANDETPMDDAYEIREKYEHDVDLVIDGGFCGTEPTTVISMIEGNPEVIRKGKGTIEFL